MMGTGEGKKGRLICSFTRIYLIIPIVFVAGIMFIVSCTKMNEFNIGKDFVESQTRLQVIDTYRVDLSTILLDSLTSSSTETVFIGNYKDEVFGSVKCESYFDLAYEAFSEIEEKAIYDSSAFILVYTGYSYGDTTSLMEFGIHMLTENIVPFENGYLYNNSSFDYVPEAFGTVRFYPEPSSKKDTSVSIPANALGEELFTLIRDKDEKVSSAEWFNDYIKGFVLTPGNAENKAVIGFDAAQGQISLRIYYHFNKEEPEKHEILIKMGEAKHQFNHVSYDLTSTSLQSIKMEGNEISSDKTDFKGYMQGMIGLLPKIQFPSLQNILLENRWKILKAELVVEPVKFSYDIFKLPEKLYIYDTDKENRINSVLVDDERNSLVALFELDDIFGEETRYTYDITDFINDELSDAYFDYGHGLLLGLEQEKFRSSLDRLLVEGKDPPVKLLLYYLTY